MYRPNLINIHIAKSPCYPTYGIVCEFDDGREPWDCDCATDSEEATLELAKEQYPDYEVLMWDNPLHYSKRKK